MLQVSHYSRQPSSSHHPSPLPFLRPSSLLLPLSLFFCFSMPNTGGPASDDTRTGSPALPPAPSVLHSPPPLPPRVRTASSLCLIVIATHCIDRRTFRTLLVVALAVRERLKMALQERRSWNGESSATNSRKVQRSKVTRSQKGGSSQHTVALYAVRGVSPPSAPRSVAHWSMSVGRSSGVSRHSRDTFANVAP